MFRLADLVLVNKLDLLEHLDFDLEMLLGYLEAVNSRVPHILTSARTGQGVQEWCDWLERRLSRGTNEISERGRVHTHEHRREEEHG